MSEKVYRYQSYNVNFDLGNVTITINVYHENQTMLSREEIVEEALGYAQDVNIKLSENGIDSITTLDCR